MGHRHSRRADSRDLSGVRRWFHQPRTAAVPHPSATFPAPIRFDGSVALSTLAEGGGGRLVFQGSLVFGGLRAELTFDTRTTRLSEHRGCVSTSVLLLPADEFLEFRLQQNHRGADGRCAARIQLVDAGGNPLTEKFHLGPLAARPSSFSLRFPALINAEASFTPSSGPDRRESELALTGEIAFVTGVSARLLFDRESRRDDPRFEQIADLEIVPAATRIEFSAQPVWSGNRECRLTSIQFLDAGGRTIGDERAAPPTLSILGDEHFAPAALSIQ